MFLGVFFCGILQISSVVMKCNVILIGFECATMGDEISSG